MKLINSHTAIRGKGITRSHKSIEISDKKWLLLDIKKKKNLVPRCEPEKNEKNWKTWFDVDA